MQFILGNRTMPPFPPISKLKRMRNRLKLFFPATRVSTLSLGGRGAGAPKMSKPKTEVKFRQAMMVVSLLDVSIRLGVLSALLLKVPLQLS